MNTLEQVEQQEMRRILEWERRVEQLVRSKGGSASAKEFQSIVNVVFHDVEAVSYDKLHREMWESLRIVFDQLARDVKQVLQPNAELTLADVGCGTGLATEFMLKTSLQTNIDMMIMVDTSNEMLSRCKSRGEDWRIKPQFIHGQIDELPDHSADVLIVSSLLHHLTDIIGFCRHVKRVLRPGGFFIHLQDPNRDIELNDYYLKRRELYFNALKKQRRSFLWLPTRSWKWLSLKYSKLFKRGYLHDVNSQLIAKGVILKPLSPRELWSITDLRERDLPISAVDGICAKELEVVLEGFKNIAIHTYSFFGPMSCHLPSELAKEEKRLFSENCLEGSRIAGVWQLRN